MLIDLALTFTIAGITIGILNVAHWLIFRA
jgi:hypothetical protein